MGSDYYWTQVTKLPNGNYRCRYCIYTFFAEKSTPKRIKYHLKGTGDYWIPPCPGAPEDVKTAANEATKKYAVSATSNKVMSAHTVETPGPTDAIFERVFTVIKQLICTQSFVPSVASAVFYCGAGWDLSLMKPPVRNPPFYAGTALDSKEVKEILTGFKDTMEILTMRGNGVDFLGHSEDIVQHPCGRKLIQMVKFLTESTNFWADAYGFMILLRPLMEVLEELTSCGTSVGNLARACEKAREGYHLVHADLSDRAVVILTEFFDSIHHGILNTGKYLDPEYLARNYQTVQNQAYQAIHDFSLLFVDHGELEAFEQELGLYLVGSNELFNDVALHYAAHHHPAKFWRYCAQRTPLLARYATIVVSMKFGDIPSDVYQLLKLFDGEANLEEWVVDGVGMLYRHADGEKLTAFLARNHTLVGGYKEVCSKLKGVSYLGWGYLDEGKYESLLANLESNLR